MPIPGTFDDPKKTAPHASQYPVITAVAAGSISGGSATITWTTDRASSSQVFYGTAPNQDPLPQRSTYNSSAVTSHSVVLSGLTPGKFYFFYVQSFYVDSLARSATYGFTAA